MFLFCIALVVFGIVGLLALFCPKWVEQNIPWINKDWIKPIISYFFVASVRKVTIAYFSTFSIVSAINPILKLCCRINWDDKNKKIWLELNWGDDWIDWSSLSIYICATIGYTLYIWYETKKLKIDMTKSQEEKLDRALKRLSNNDFANSIIPELKTAVSELKVKTSRDFIDKLIGLCMKDFFPDKILLMYLEHQKALSLLYVDGKAATESVEKAYGYMLQSNQFDPDIASLFIKRRCGKGDFKTLDSIVERLQMQEPNNSAISIYNIFNSSNPIEEFNSMTDEEGRIQLLAELMMMDPNQFNVKLINTDSFSYFQLTSLTFDNIPLWALNLTVALNRFLSKWVYSPEKQLLIETEESKKLYEMTDNLIEHLKGTELPQIMPDLDFIHALTAYIHDKNKNWLSVMKQCKYADESKDFYYIAYASMLLAESEIKEAAAFLGTYGQGINSQVLNYRLHIANMLADIQLIKEIFSTAAEEQVEFEDMMLTNILCAIQYYNAEVFPFITQLNVKHELSKQLLVYISQYFANKPIDIEFIKKNINNSSSIFIPYITLIYEKYIGLDEAVSLIEPQVDYHYFDIRAFVYYNLLKKDVKYSSKLYVLCEKLRENGAMNIETLNTELCLAEKKEDYKRALTITNIMFSYSPQNGIFVEHHLMALHRNGKTQAIKDFYPHLNEYTYDNTRSISNVFNVYLGIDMPKEALEFLYAQVVKMPLQPLRDMYYQASVLHELSPLIHQQSDVIEYGSYIKAEINGKEEYVEVLQGSQYEELIGKRVGYSTTIDVPFHPINVSIRGIFNKYHKLYVEIMEDISSHKSKQIKAFTLEDLMQGDGILSNMAKLSGRDKNYEKAMQEFMNNYKIAQTTLYLLLPEHSTIAELYDKLFGTFPICMLPHTSSLGSQYFQDVDFTELQPVLDLSGLLMMEELSSRFKLSFEKKFLLSKTIERMVEDALISETHGLPNSISMYAAKNITYSVSESGTNMSVLVCKLKQLCAWIEENCIVETDDAILNIEETHLENDVLRQYMTALMMTMHKSRILITEDWVFTVRRYEGLFAMSCSNWLDFVIPNRTEEIDRYFFRLHYLGCQLSGDMLCELHRADDILKSTLLPVTLDNISRYNKNIDAVLEACVSLVQGFVLPGAYNYIYLLLRSMFTGLDIKMAKKLYVMSLNKSDNITYRNAVNDAFKSINPIIL